MYIIFIGVFLCVLLLILMLRRVNTILHNYFKIKVHIHFFFFGINIINIEVLIKNRKERIVVRKKNLLY